MIRYALVCDREDAFEGWFRNSADFDAQAAAGALACPICGSSAVRKDVMAPAVLKGGRGLSEAAFETFAAKVRADIQERFDYVGDGFADEARAIHEGEAEDRPIWGEARADEARDLVAEGVPVAPLPAPFAPLPPRKVN